MKLLESDPADVFRADPETQEVFRRRYEPERPRIMVAVSTPCNEHSNYGQLFMEGRVKRDYQFYFQSPEMDGLD